MNAFQITLANTGFYCTLIVIAATAAQAETYALADMDGQHMEEMADAKNIFEAEGRYMDGEEGGEDALMERMEECQYEVASLTIICNRVDAAEEGKVEMDDSGCNG